MRVKVVPKFFYLRIADDIEMILFLTIKQALNLIHDSECTRKW